MTENREAFNIFMRVRLQVLRAGMDGAPVDLNHLAVWAMIDAYGIKDRLSVFDKVNRVWHEIRANEEEE